MSEMLLYVFSVFFGLISIVLAVYVYKLSKQLKQKKVTLQNAQDAHAASVQEQKKYLIDSIRIISRSVLEKQCPMAEGCIRIKVLIDNYSPQLHQVPELQVLELMYSKTAHIPTLDEWKKLGSSEKKQFQSEISLLENEHHDSIMEAVRFLKNYPFEQRAH